MKAWEHYTDEEFFQVLRSDAFIDRFYGRCHPIYEENGGLEYYNPDTRRAQGLATAERMDTRPAHAERALASRHVAGIGT